MIWRHTKRAGSSSGEVKGPGAGVDTEMDDQMERAEIVELHYIAHLGNLTDIMDIGIWCRNRVEKSKLRPTSVADDAIMAKRRVRRLSNYSLLLDNVNLYLNARNAMLYRVSRETEFGVAVLRVSPSVLDLPDVRITPQNAAAGDAPHDKPLAEGLPLLSRELIFSESWNSGDDVRDKFVRQHMMAEVLVPKFVEPAMVLGAYVANAEAARIATGAGLNTSVNRGIFMLVEDAGAPEWR
jgi:hypothetical protein